MRSKERRQDYATGRHPLLAKADRLFRYKRPPINTVIEYDMLAGAAHVIGVRAVTSQSVLVNGDAVEIVCDTFTMRPVFGA